MFEFAGCIHVMYFLFTFRGLCFRVMCFRGLCFQGLRSVVCVFEVCVSRDTPRNKSRNDKMDIDKDFGIPNSSILQLRFKWPGDRSIHAYYKYEENASRYLSRKYSVTSRKRDEWWKTNQCTLKGLSQPHLCFCLHARIWLLYFIRSLSKRRKITVKLLKIIKHTFRNTAYSKTIRIRFTMLYQ